MISVITVPILVAKKIIISIMTVPTLVAKKDYQKLTI